MKNIGILIALIIVIGGGWWLYKGGATSGAEHAGDTLMKGDTSHSATDTPALAGNVVVGTWKSTEDAKFVRTISSDGTFTDTYVGQPDATVTGPWTTFTSENAPDGFTYPKEADVTYLQLGLGNDALYFKVTKATDTDLELVYLNRGGVLSFTRTQ